MKDGGGLIVSYSTSLYSQSGVRRTSFALEDLIRVRSVELPAPLKNYQAMIGGPNDLYLLDRKGSDEMGSKWKDQLVPAWYYEPVEVLDGGRIIMDIVTGDDSRPVLPGVVLSSLGKGKVLYSASSLESLYGSNGNPVLKELIAHFIDIVSSAPFPFAMEAPSGLMANLARSGNNYVLHLTNWTGNKFEKNHVMEDYIAEAKQVSVKFTIPGNKSIESVRSLTGSAFTTNTVNNTLEILIPCVGAYEGIVIILR